MSETTSQTPPDRVRPAVYGALVAGAAGAFWGILFILTGAFRSWLAVLLGALVGGALRVSGAGSRGRGLQAFAAALTIAGWWLAFYLAFFGLHLTEVAEQHGHAAADRVPVTLMLTWGFLAHFAGELPELLRASHFGWLAAGVAVAVLLTGVRR